MATVEEVRVPDIGDATDVDVIEVLVSPGQSIEKDADLITLETDKATMDIPSPVAGVIKSISINVGDKVSKDSLILTLETGAADGPLANDEEPAQAAPTKAESASAQLVQIQVPDIGDASDVDVIEVMISPGDSIAKEDGLITLETDKATMDVPSPVAGVVKDVKIKVGDKVSQGTLVALVESSEGGAPEEAAQPVKAAAPAPVQDIERAPTPAAASLPQKAPVASTTGNTHASPSVRRFARELGADIAQVPATGRKGRILKDDVVAFVKKHMQAMAQGKASAGGGMGFDLPAWPKVDFAKFGEVEEVPLTRIQKISGPALHRNWVSIPHVTQFDEADITEMEAFRKAEKANAEKAGAKLTPVAFIMKAVAKAMLAHPIFNSSLSEDGQSLVMKKYVHLGVAVDTPGGLVVPVFRDVDKKGLYELGKELVAVSNKAREGKLTAADMQGSCFTISSLGGIGGTAFTPIVNAPDVAILGLSKSEIKPKWQNNEFVPRLMLPLSLSYDHRVIDGAVAARFITELSGLLQDIRKLIL